MRSLLSSHLAAAILFASSILSAAEGPSIFLVQGTVEKAEKGSLKIATGERPKRTIDLKITGTSNLRILSPQKRADRTVVTQRNADAADLEPGQEIAAIYTNSDGEKILLSAVAKPAGKD